MEAIYHVFIKNSPSKMISRKKNTLQYRRTFKKAVNWTVTHSKNLKNKLYNPSLFRKYVFVAKERKPNET